MAVQGRKDRWMDGQTVKKKRCEKGRMKEGGRTKEVNRRNEKKRKEGGKDKRKVNLCLSR